LRAIIRQSSATGLELQIGSQLLLSGQSRISQRAPHPRVSLDMLQRVFSSREQTNPALVYPSRSTRAGVGRRFSPRCRHIAGLACFRVDNPIPTTRLHAKIDPLSVEELIDACKRGTWTISYSQEPITTWIQPLDNSDPRAGIRNRITTDHDGHLRMGMNFVSSNVRQCAGQYGQNPYHY
jgi:hypothetical protein